MSVVQQLVDDVLQEGNFDATSDQALRWLNRRHRKMIARARSYRKTVEAGPTVANQLNYAIPVPVVDIMEVLVAGVTYGHGKHQDLSAGRRGFLWLSGEGGLVIPDESAIGATQIALYPTPAQAGLSVQVRATFLPDDLSVSDDSTLRVPVDFHDELIAGAIATGMGRVEHRPDLAGPFEQTFSDGCEEFRQRVLRRYRGSGAATIRVRGFNA